MVTSAQVPNFLTVSKPPLTDIKILGLLLFVWIGSKKTSQLAFTTIT